MVLTGCILAFFFSILLLSKKHRSKPDLLLSSWMIVIALHLMLFYAANNNLYQQYPHLIGIDLPFPIVHVLCLYFYVRMICTNQHQFFKTDIFHFLPLIAAYTYLVPFFMKPGADKYSYLQDIRVNEKFFLGVLTFVMLVSGILYITLSIRMINKYKIYVSQHFSFNERINLNWLTRLIYGMAFIWSVVLVFKIFQVASFKNLQNTGDYLIFLAVSLFVSFLGYYGIRQTTIFSNHSFNEKPDDIKSASSKTERYLKSGLKDKQAERIQKDLIQLMILKKPFLDSVLNLDMLAEELNTSPNYLSQVINEHFSKNFYDFINAYRIEEFKNKANNHNLSNFSILGLAFECGFNSKSAFYSAFKKEVGTTPSEFLKNNN